MPKNREFSVPRHQDFRLSAALSQRKVAPPPPAAEVRVGKHGTMRPRKTEVALGSDEADGEELRCFVEGGKGTHDLGVDLRWCPDLHSPEKGREVVLVHAVQEGGSCALAGLIVGDEIRRLNDTPLQVRT